MYLNVSILEMNTHLPFSSGNPVLSKKSLISTISGINKMTTKGL